jgi:hypothetical protein
LHRWLTGARRWDGRLARTVDFAWTGVRLARLSGTGRLTGRTSNCGDGTGRSDQSGSAPVHVVELLAVLCSLALILDLRRHGRYARAAVGCDLRRLRTNVDATTTAVVGDAVDGRVVDDDRAVIDVGDPRGVDAVHSAVVVEVVALPITAVIAASRIAEAVVDAAVEANVRTPEAAVKDVAAAEESPISGGPESSIEGWSAPGAGNPVVARRSVSPVPGSPEIVGSGGFGLFVFGQRWGRFVGLFEGLLAGVYLRLIVIVDGGVIVIALIGVLVIGLGALRRGVRLVLWGRRILFGTLLRCGLRANAQDSCRCRLRGRCGLGLTAVYRCHVGIGRVGAGVVGDGCGLYAFVTA